MIHLLTRFPIVTIRAIGWMGRIGGLAVVGGSFRNVIAYMTIKDANPIFGTRIPMALDTAVCLLMLGWLAFFFGVGFGRIARRFEESPQTLRTRRLTRNQVALITAILSALGTITAALIQLFKG